MQRHVQLPSAVKALGCRSQLGCTGDIFVSIYSRSATQGDGCVSPMHTTPSQRLTPHVHVRIIEHCLAVVPTQRSCAPLSAVKAAAAAAAAVSPVEGQAQLPIQQETSRKLQEQHNAVLLPHGVQQHQLPQHVALIMDGNSRWATRQGLPAFVGHERGVAALKSAVIAAREWGIRALTVYAFSLENWQRDAAEVSFLMDLFHSALQQQLPELQDNGVKLQFMGQLHRLPPALQQQAAACAAATAANTGLLLTVAVSYSAQDDMAQAVQQLAQQVAAGQLRAEEITLELISHHLSSSVVTGAVGPPDLCIRTSGEQRLSNFMLFESAYTELCFLDVLWPAFSKDHFAAALQQYAQRQRRYGRRK